MSRDKKKWYDETRICTNVACKDNLVFVSILHIHHTYLLSDLTWWRKESTYLCTFAFAIILTFSRPYFCALFAKKFTCSHINTFYYYLMCCSALCLHVITGTMATIFDNRSSNISEATIFCLRLNEKHILQRINRNMFECCYIHWHD